jgi:putative transposase
MSENPPPGQKALRRGRYSQKEARYFITFCSFTRAPILFHSGIPEIIFDSLINQSDEFDLIASVVMPDHVHVIIHLLNNNLSKTLQTFKSKSAIAINRNRKSSGRVWQKGYFDHKFRGDEDLGPILKYMWNNPSVPGKHFRCNRLDWKWFKTVVQEDFEYPIWITNQH